MLLKGAGLKNTKWIIGFVVYTGEDTRIMMNSMFKTQRKVSKIDKQLNSFIAQIFILQIIMCVALAILSNFVHETASPDEIKEHG